MLDKTTLQNIITKSLQNITPQKLIHASCRLKNDILTINNHSIQISKNKKIYLFGSGKAVQSMAKAMGEILGDIRGKTLLIGPYEPTLELTNLEYIQSSHPVPSEKSIEAAKKLESALSELDNDDVFIYLLSGGSSALVELPIEEITLEEFQETTQLMLKNAMPIEAINCVRKHLSKVKGGKLTTLTQAKGYVIVLSDVLGDSLEDIASAPFYIDSTTFQDAVDYLIAYKVFHLLPNSIQHYLNLGISKKKQETLKVESPLIKHFIIGSNTLFLQSIQKEIELLNTKVQIFEQSLFGDTTQLSQELISFIEEKKEGCFIFGGEATVLVKGSGQGGRNQHLVLEFLKSYPKDKEIIFLSVASDGIDGNSNAAGAIIDSQTIQEMKNKNSDITKALKNFDSYNFFKQLNSLIISGPTHNNLLDAVVIYIQKKGK